MKICHRFFACLKLFNPKCKGLLSECLFLKLLSSSERFVMWTPQACVMVEVWLNTLNGTAWLWNLRNWVPHSAKICSLLIKNAYAKETLCIWNLNGLLSFGSDSFQRKVLKERNCLSHGQQNSPAPAVPLPQLLLLPPALPALDVLCLGPRESRALLSQGELTVHKGSPADPGRRFDGEKSSLFRAGLCKWVNGKFCFLRVTMTSPQP